MLVRSLGAQVRETLPLPDLLLPLRQRRMPDGRGAAADLLNRDDRHRWLRTVGGPPPETLPAYRGWPGLLLRVWCALLRCALVRCAAVLGRQARLSVLSGLHVRAALSRAVSVLRGGPAAGRAARCGRIGTPCHSATALISSLSLSSLASSSLLSRILSFPSFSTPSCPCLLQLSHPLPFPPLPSPLLLCPPPLTLFPLLSFSPISSLHTTHTRVYRLPDWQCTGLAQAGPTGPRSPRRHGWWNLPAAATPSRSTRAVPRCPIS